MPTPRQLIYSPSPVPTSIDLRLLDWLRREFHSIRDALAQAQPDLLPLSAAPPRPKEGMLRYADGVGWDPGAGKGVYVYDGTTWVKL